MPIPATFLGRWLTWALSSLQQSDALQDEALLRYYAQEWDRYTTGANYINRLFTYLNRHWVKRERDEGRKGVYPVYTVSCRGRIASLRLTHYLHCPSARACSMENQLFHARAEQEPEACGGNLAID